MNQIWNHNHWWISKIDFFVSSDMLILCLMFLSPLSLERRRLATSSLKTQIPEWLGISIWNLGPINKIRSFVRGSPWWSMSIKTKFFQFFVLIYLFFFVLFFIILLVLVFCIYHLNFLYKKNYMKAKCYFVRGKKHHGPWVLYLKPTIVVKRWFETFLIVLLLPL